MEIVTEPSIFLLVVIRFPNSIGTNCETNSNAFTVFKKNLCFPICDEIGDRDKYSPYFIISVRSRIRFKFLSNSSINTDMGVSVLMNHVLILCIFQSPSIVFLKLFISLCTKRIVPQHSIIVVSFGR